MRQGTESDIQADPGVARSRDSGGRTPDGEPDTHSTTGTTRNETHVGRVSGDDAGASGESGAEARAEDGRGASGTGQRDTDVDAGQAEDDAAQGGR